MYMTLVSDFGFWIDFECFVSLPVNADGSSEYIFNLEEEEEMFYVLKIKGGV